MKLTVKNFGPIKSAKVDVKPMTVFVGPSNTGKSYLAVLIYTIVKVLKDVSERLPHFSLGDSGEEYTVEEIISDNKKFNNLTKKVFLSYLESIRKQWESETLRCFGEEWENIIQQNSAPASIVISDDNNKITLDLLSSEKNKSLPLNALFEKVKERIRSHSEQEYPTFKGIDVFILSHIMAYEISGSLNFLPSAPQLEKSDDDLVMRAGMRKGINAHYLPAVRGGLMQSHRILVSAVIARAPTIGLTGAEIVPFTGVLADFLEKLLMITDDGSRAIHRRRQRETLKNISSLSGEIEQKIMHGAIKTKTLATRYPDFRYQFLDKNKESRDISLMHASSSVSELAPIVLFIRYYLSSGDVFIVEEPEAHLHPAAQRLIAGVLVELVNIGVQVIVTTHSDIILEQISNFIHADKIPEAKVLNRKAKGRTLDEDESRCYLFKAPAGRGKGTTVKSISFDEEMGIVTEDHSDVSSDLYNEAVGLFNARERAKERNADDNI